MLMQCCKLSARVLKTYTHAHTYAHTHTSLLSNVYATYWFKAFKEIPHQSLANHLHNRTETSVISDCRGYRLQRFNPEKLLKKQITPNNKKGKTKQSSKGKKLATTKNMGGEGAMTYKITTLYYIKCPVLDKEL